MYINYCQACNRYTMQEKCPICKKPAATAHPAKFSPEDKDSAERIEFQRRFPGENLLTRKAYDYKIE